MASYVIAAALFVVGSSYLLQFVIEPPGASTASLEHLELRSKADDALGLLVGSPGVPTAWDASAAEIDALKRLGLVENGASIRLDADKFDALAKGKLTTASSSNAGIDYAEAKAALGLSGYEFHIRAYPLLAPGSDGEYGLADFGDFRVAYIGDFQNNAPEPSAVEEITQLEALNIDFTYDSTQVTQDDVIPDSSGEVREDLLPNIGASIQQTIISSGSGTAHTFYRVPASTYSGLASGAGQTRALALSGDGATLGYTKNLEIRAIVGKVNLDDVTMAKLEWKEWVDTDRGNLSYDCQDYGFVEVSPDGGQTWIALTNSAAERSDDCNVLPATPQLNAWTPRQIADLTVACPACEDNPSVLVGFHWIADNDNTLGYGWVVDDVTVSALPSGATPMRKTFEDPEYDLVIIGSNVDNNALEPQEIKEAIRDYVDIHGGRILVTGPSDTSVNWLDRLFDAGIAGTSAGVSTPDTTHPLLTLPNPLNYDAYQDPDELWDFTNSEDAALFTAVMAATDLKHALSVSRLGAWGEGTTDEGSLILSAYRPYLFESDEEMRRFYANAITYGKFHYLYLDYGPSVPSDEAVASATRTATMNMHRIGAPAYTEMAFIIYVWPGMSTAATASAVTIPASPPTEVSVAGSHTPARATIQWKEPTSNGSAKPVQYHIFRGYSPDAIPTAAVDAIATVPAPSAASWVAGQVFSYTDSTVQYGVTYYYEVRLETTGGVLGTPSSVVSVTPIGPPGAPGTPTATGLAGKIRTQWTAPTDTGGGTIFGYRVQATTDDGATWTDLGEIGAVTTYDHAVNDQTARKYKVEARNAQGLGTASGVSNAASAVQPIDPPPTFNVATGDGPGNLTLTWVAPDVVGQTLQGFRISRASASGGPYTELAYLNNPLNVSFKDAGLGPSLTYYYKVQGVTEYGDGLLTAERSATTLAVPGVPTWGTVVRTPVSNLRTLTWNAPASSDWPVVRYDVYRAQTETGALTLIGASTTTGYVDAPGVGTFWYAVKAVSAAGASEASARLQSVPTQLVAPTLTASVGSGPNNLTLVWTKPVPDDPAIIVTGYQVQYALAASGPFVDLVTINDGNTLTHQDALGTGNPNVTRYYKVKALSNDGAGAYSDIKNAKTMATPNTPTWGSVVKLGGDRTLTWNAPASDWPVARYDVYRAETSNAALTKIGETVGAAATYTDSPGNGNKYYAVVAVSAAGSSAMSERIQSN